jgi:DNA topoisomerase I
VRLVVEREREIKAFVPEEGWRVYADLVRGEDTLRVELSKISDKKAALAKYEEVAEKLSAIGWDVSAAKESMDKNGWKERASAFRTAFSLQSIVERPSKRSPGMPFTTSLLQQEASRKLGFSVSQTMSVAQILYQNGHITYMRTDSVNLSTEVVGACRKYVERVYGADYVPKTPRVYKTKQANAQEAHEAIRPTDVELSPDKIDLDGNELRLYRLIWERTVACQMTDANINTTTYSFAPAAWRESEWTAKGEVIVFPGFMKLYIEGTDDEEAEGSSVLPAMEEGETAESKKFIAKQTFSRPPARYSEAMLVKKLESEGIGRPSTYAPTIATIVDRGYVEKIEKRLHPTDIAFLVNDFLEAAFARVMDYKFTANIEEELDEIATGGIEWRKMLAKFYESFAKDLETAMADKSKIVEEVGKACPKCGAPLVFKYSKSGKFIGCSAYPECKHIENIADPERDARLAALREKYEGKPCPAGGTMVVKTGRFGPFLSSSLYPDVKWIGKIENPKIQALEEKHGGVPCGVCKDGVMHVKSSRRGPFLACSNYPECKNTANLPRAKKAEEMADEE